MAPASGTFIATFPASLANFPVGKESDAAELVVRGPLTPDHVIRTKRVPMLGRDVNAYARDYRAYFDRNRSRSAQPLTMLDAAPRVVIDPELGLLTAGRTARDAAIASDIARSSVMTC